VSGDGRPIRVAFLGFGLIAGSIARALRTVGPPTWRAARLSAWSPSGLGPRTAVEDGIINDAAEDPSAALVGADVVVLAPPPLQLLGLIEALGGDLREHLSPTTVVTDVGSTKAAVIAAADRAGLRFVGGHPMAGREVSGYAAATPDLFVGRPWVVVPSARAQRGDRRLVEELAAACGARPVSLSAREHDAAVAGISHLPLVAAAALVEAVAGTARTPEPGWELASGLAAGGWRDMTRLARGDVVMGVGIAATNAGPLAVRIRSLQSALDGWLEELERDGGPDPARLEARLREARERLEGEEVS
jgi:prephenate dehydrogenase